MLFAMAATDRRCVGGDKKNINNEKIQVHVPIIQLFEHTDCQRGLPFALSPLGVDSSNFNCQQTKGK